jgi:hypothetical protein
MRFTAMSFGGGVVLEKDNTSTDLNITEVKAHSPHLGYYQLPLEHHNAVPAKWINASELSFNTSAVSHNHSTLALDARQVVDSHSANVRQLDMKGEDSLLERSAGSETKEGAAESHSKSVPQAVNQQVLPVDKDIRIDHEVSPDHFEQIDPVRTTKSHQLTFATLLLVLVVVVFGYAGLAFIPVSSPDAEDDLIREVMDFEGTVLPQRTSRVVEINDNLDSNGYTSTGPDEDIRNISQESAVSSDNCQPLTPRDKEKGKDWQGADPRQVPDPPKPSPDQQRKKRNQKA